MKKTLLLFLLLPVLSFAQVVDLVKWDATLSANRNAPTYVNTLYPTPVVADVITAGAGTISYNTDNASQPYFSIGGWPNPQQNEGSYDVGKYIEFKITPKTSNKIDLSTFSFSHRSQGNTQKFQIQYSTDDTFKSNVKVLVPETVSTTVWATATSSFSPELNPVLPGQVVYIRVYAYSSNDNFHFKIIDTPAKITGSVSVFDSSKILAINDYVATTKEVGINISPLSNDVKKENVTSITISTPPLASQGSAILNPDKTITFNPAKNFTGKAAFKYTISNAGNPSSEGTVEVNVTNLTPESLVIWNAKSSERPKPTVNSPYVTAANVTSNGGVSDVGNGYNNNEDSNNPFYSTSGWPNTQYNGGTLDPTRYLEFKMTADANHKVDLSTFGFIYRTTGGTTQRIKISYSKSSTPNTNDKVLLADSVTPTTWTTINSAFSSDLNTLSAGDTVYIRVYVYNTYDPFQFRTKTAINGSIKDTNTLLANNDDISTPVNQSVTVPILVNDVIGSSPVQEITVTQPTNGAVIVNSDNSLTFTPASTFTGTTSFTYTLRNANSNYSSATVGVLGTAAVCAATPIGGNNYWKGYVYTYTGNVPAAATYVGSVAEKAIFDRNVGEGVITGDASVEANVFCGTVPSDKFFVKYLMKATTAIGTYNITFGADDGVRLYIDGTLVPVTPTNSWSDHSYVTYFAQYKFTTAGPHDFVLEYYENAGSSRVSFSYGLVKGDPTVYGTNVWNVYGYTAPNFNLPSVNYAGTYVDSKLDINTTNYWAKEKSPSSAVIWEGAPMPIDNFTISYKRQGFPCGNYNIQVVNCDDDMQIYIDGTLVYTAGANINAPVVISGGPYKLKSDSKVEIRLREDGGDAKMAVTFIDVPVTYNGSGTVPANTSIIVKNNITLNSSIEVCSCTIDPGKILTIPLDKVLTVKENITVGAAGKLLVENGGSLVQTNKNAIYTGATNSFELQRNSQPVRRQDYTYWSSPVTEASGFTLKKLSPNTDPGKYYRYDPATGWVLIANGALSMKEGVGYIVRAPETNSSTVGSIYPASFIGIPNNGDLSFTPTENKFNLIGNPYPSSLDAVAFIKKNTGNITGALYFWTHNTLPANTDPAQANKYFYTTNDYAVFNLTGSVAGGKAAPSDKNSSNIPNGKVGSGQGFFVRGLTNVPLIFTNDMRLGESNSQYFKTTSSTTEKGLIWLNFTNEQGAFKQTLVGYLDDATNDFDNDYDAITFNGNAYVDFYSVNETKKLTIQGRALPFDNVDKVPLGYRTTIAGNFTISIDHVEGLLNEQPVFLEDKSTGVIHDLRSSDYTFSTEIGTFTERLILRYKTDKTLGTDDFGNLENGILLSVKNKVINLMSSKEDIKEVSVFDITGKLLYNKKKVGNNELQIQNLQSGNQVLLVKITLENNFTVTKKIIFN
ncbi:T9SS sorting signal type C domain-containing protein [Flavobacterium bizetiae]|uniref:Ig-like domain-containing protein n=1 Tax=Flavobacterium bizetiae TaxID=2704140 RepID=UPI0021E778FB|nr:T9SS sorting signal type C domain-containing protein [Flavobacterium bizetiae]UTN05090.1 T9SS sorting signal type C domain-containing protein [Flavobacterium bizetiae]